MRGLRLNKKAFLSLAVGLAVLSSGAAALADTKPYFKVYGGDVFAGGAFSPAANVSSCATGYQYTGDGQNGGGDGGIYAYAKSNGGKGAGGASDQYGAFALGPIDGTNNSSTAYGFYSADGLAGQEDNYLTFANSPAASFLSTGSVWGGSFEGSVPQSSCIPDYYDTQLPASGTSGLKAPNYLSGQAKTGVYTISGAPAHLNDKGATTVKFGNNVTVFVNGSVYIANNITYNLNKDTNIPQFTLVAKGNIYVDPNVTQLDGFYIAQPSTPTATDGQFWTCHDSSNSSSIISLWFPPNCQKQLVVNGGVVARQFNLLRLNGDVAAAAPGESLNSPNPAEIFNLDAPAVLSGSYFNSSNSSFLKVESFTNLPPVF